jgi:tRNA(fMet)-specific endonuclease VapC
MTGRFLLDTNAVIALFANEPATRQHLTDDAEVFIPVIVLGELYYGAHKSARAAENTARINEFAATAAIVLCDTVTAQCYGRIKTDLRAKGRSIPENDLWIAAIARQHSLTLITSDGHFAQIEELAIEKW